MDPLENGSGSVRLLGDPVAWLGSRRTGQEYLHTMAEMTCPKCQSAMSRHAYADVTVSQCEACQGIFLDRADLGALIEAETDWHAHRSTHTAPLPKITAEMTEPPPARPASRSFLDSLFRAESS